jgi:hypothetical protein
MRKLMTIVGALFFASVVSSCGGSVGTSEEEVVKEKPCDCENLFLDENTWKYSKGTELYTGTCETRDQYDFVTKHLEFKNGFKVFQLIKKKVAGKYVTVDSVYYDGLNPINGFKTHIMANGLGTYVDDFKSYTNGALESGRIILSSGYNSDTREFVDMATIYYVDDYVRVLDNGTGFVKQFTDEAKAISNKFEVFEIH